MGRTVGKKLSVGQVGKFSKKRIFITQEINHSYAVWLLEHAVYQDSRQSTLCEAKQI